MEDSPECSCDACSKSCMRPCWGFPHEIETLLDHDSDMWTKLTLDYWEGSGSFNSESASAVWIIGPALKGYGGKQTPSWPQSEEGCIFWHDGLCDLHEQGLKPYEGRVAHHAIKPTENQHRKVMQSWATNEGHAVVARWRALRDGN